MPSFADAERYVPSSVPQIKKQEAAANAKRIKAEEAARLKAQMELFKPQQAQKVPFGVGASRGELGPRCAS